MVRPDRKVTIGGLVGSVVTITLWVLYEVWGLDIPPGVEGAFVVLLTFVVSYVVRNDLGENKTSTTGGAGGRSAVGQMDDREAKG